MPLVAYRLQQCFETPGFGGVHACGGFVEREQQRFGGQRAGDLQTALFAVGKMLGQRLRGPLDADIAQQFARALRRCACSSARVPRSRSSAPNTPARVRTWRPIMTFSSAVRLANRRMFWKVRAMPACASRCGLPDVVVHDR